MLRSAPLPTRPELAQPTTKSEILRASSALSFIADTPYRGETLPGKPRGRGEVPGPAWLARRGRNPGQLRADWPLPLPLFVHYLRAMDLTALDIVVVLLVGAGLILGFLRGFVSELLSLFAWILAILA